MLYSTYFILLVSSFILIQPPPESPLLYLPSSRPIPPDPWQVKIPWRHPHHDLLQALEGIKFVCPILYVPQTVFNHTWGLVSVAMSDGLINENLNIVTLLCKPYMINEICQVWTPNQNSRHNLPKACGEKKLLCKICIRPIETFQQHPSISIRTNKQWSGYLQGNIKKQHTKNYKLWYWTQNRIISPDRVLIPKTSTSDIKQNQLLYWFKTFGGRSALKSNM